MFEYGEQFSSSIIVKKCILPNVALCSAALRLAQYNHMYFYCRGDVLKPTYISMLQDELDLAQFFAFFLLHDWDEKL